MALTFDAVDDDCNAGSATAVDDIFDATSGGAFFCWYYPTGAGEGSAGRFFDKISSGTGCELQLASAGAKVQLLADWTTTDGVWVTTNNVNTSNAWNTVSVNYNAAGGTTADPTFCVNGSILTVGSGITETTNPAGSHNSDGANSLIIGNRAANDRTFQGRLAAVTFWKDYTLSNNEMFSLSQGVSPLFIKADKQVLFTEMWGASLTFDYRGNALTLNNGPADANHAPYQALFTHTMPNGASVF